MLRSANPYSKDDDFTGNLPLIAGPLAVSKGVGVILENNKKAFFLWNTLFCWLKLEFLLSRVEVKTKLAESIDTLHSNVRSRIALSEQLELPSLALAPYCKLLVLRMSCGNVWMSVLPHKVLQLVQAFFPEDGMGIPNEAQTVKGQLARLCHVGAFPLALESPLVSLSLHPLR